MSILLLQIGKQKSRSWKKKLLLQKSRNNSIILKKVKLEVANPKLMSDLQATSNKLEIAKNNQNSNKNKAKPFAEHSKKVEAEIKEKGLNDVIPSGTTVAGYNSSTGTFCLW